MNDKVQEWHRNLPGVTSSAIDSGVLQDIAIKFARNIKFIDIFDRLESPIEYYFVLGFVPACIVHGISIESDAEEFDEYFSAGCEMSATKIGLRITPQFKIDGKRVDFKIHAGRENVEGKFKTVSIAVECDGFAYHHGSPESAARDKARDRLLSSSFDAIVRFTGVELRNDPYACAKEVIRLIEAKI